MNLEAKYKKRKRTKLLKHQLMKQMEFYFSDANLRHSKFLMDLIKSNLEEGNGFVPIDVFLNFNEILKISNNKPQLLISSLKNSKKLELNQLETAVRRVEPLDSIESYQADERTIYVENLPSDVTQLNLRKVFTSIAGPVALVTIPKYKIGNGIKGFAFVEFVAAESAERAYKYFSGDKLSPLKNWPRKRRNSGRLRRKRKASFSSTISPLSKRQKLSPVAEVDEDNPPTEVKPKRKRQRKHKKKKNKSDPKIDSAFSDLRVLTKAQWDTEKQIYKKLHMKRYTEMKQELKSRVPMRKGPRLLVEVSGPSDDVDSAKDIVMSKFGDIVEHFEIYGEKLRIECQSESCAKHILESSFDGLSFGYASHNDELAYWKRHSKKEDSSGRLKRHRDRLLRKYFSTNG